MKNNLFFQSLVVSFFFALPLSVSAGIVDTVEGKILLQVEDFGQAWYVVPGLKKRVFLGKPQDAFEVMKRRGVGITNSDLNKIPVAVDFLSGLRAIDSDEDGYNDETELKNGYNPNGNGRLNSDNSFAKKQRGKIFLQVENNGEAWYVNPQDNKRYYLGRPRDAFSVMRRLGLGITNENLNTISIEGEKPSLNKVVTGDEEELRTTCVGLTNCIRYRNVEISWDLPGDAFDLVSKTVGKTVSGKYSEQAVIEVKRALDKYPSGMLRRYLNRVYLLDGLLVSDYVALGTIDAHNRRIFVVINVDGDDEIEQVVHHEFAHVLSFNPDNSYWVSAKAKGEISAVNPDDFEYNGRSMYGSVENIHSFSPELVEGGLLTYYSTYNIEEDMAEMAMYMFKENSSLLGTDFWELIDTYSKLKEKFDLMVRFYTERDPVVFNEEYFRKISKE